MSGSATQKQGKAFEAIFTKALGDLHKAGHIRMAHKMVNACGTPFDYLVVGKNITYAFECKALRESKSNRPGRFRLSCLRSNQWSGLTAWMGDSRRGFVIYSFVSYDGERDVYAIPFSILKWTKNTCAGSFVDLDDPGIIHLADHDCYVRMFTCCELGGYK